MTEGLNEVAGGIKNFIQKLLKMIKDFISSITEKFNEKFRNKKLKSNIEHIRSLGPGKFGKMVEVPDVKYQSMMIDQASEEANRALDSIYNDPSYVYNTESKKKSFFKKRKISEYDAATKYADGQAERDINMLNGKIDSNMEKLCEKAEMIANKKPGVKDKIQKVLSAIGKNLKEMGNYYFIAVSGVILTVVGYNFVKMDLVNAINEDIRW